MKEKWGGWEVEAQGLFPSGLAGALGEGSLTRMLMECFYPMNQRQVERILRAVWLLQVPPSFSSGIPLGHTPLASLAWTVMLWSIHCASS